MKRFGWIGFMVLLAFVACHTPTREARRMVDRAERLADTLPDSTTRLIDSVLRMPVYFSERERMDMALLQAEALFGDHGNAISPVMDDDFFDVHTTLSTSPDLERAAEYFAKKKQYAKATHAALYSGFVQQHYNEKEAAMKSFKAAEQYGGLINDSLSVAQAEYWMGKMLYYDGMEQEALNSLLISESLIGNRYADRAFIENSKAVLYILMNQYDSAEICLQKGLVWADKAHFEKAQQKILNNYAVLCRLEKKYDHSIAYLTQMVKLNDNEETNLFLYYLNMGKTFASAKEMDSAELYFKHIETLLSNKGIMLESKVSAYDALSQFAEERGDFQNAFKFKEQREDFLAKVLVQRQEQAVYRVQHQYDYESLQNVMNQQIARKQRIIAISIVLLLCVVTWFMYRSSQRNKREAEANANLFHFMEQNKALVESNIAHEKKVLDTTQQLSDLLYARLKAMQKLDYCLKTPKDKIALKDLEKEVFGTGDHWDAIREVLVALYPGLLETLKLKYPEMDEMELRVCMLSRLKLSRLAESTLLGISVSVLDKTRTKVHKIIGQDNKQ